ncbi:MAG: hypothetical protein CR963_01115 [Gammaproteobacteria bacterium]|nr:MAG: hypothetical protein CR963_01115 [Gammaproteobacteria bacterium]
MDTQKLTIRLPESDVQFIKRFAEEHKTTVTEMIRRYLKQLQAQHIDEADAALQSITGLLPQNITEADTRRLYADYMMDKHR